MTDLRRMCVIAALAGSVLGLSALSASAAVICRGNVCWHAHEKYNYPPKAGVIIHEDEWRPGPDISFREHEGRGYWDGDVWTDFQ